MRSRATRRHHDRLRSAADDHDADVPARVVLLTSMHRACRRGRSCGTIMHGAERRAIIVRLQSPIPPTVCSRAFDAAVAPMRRADRWLCAQIARCARTTPRPPAAEARDRRDRRLEARSRRAPRRSRGVSPERFSEDELVERPAVELLAELGWETVNAYEESSAPAGRSGATAGVTSSSTIACSPRCAR